MLKLKPVILSAAVMILFTSCVKPHPPKDDTSSTMTEQSAVSSQEPLPVSSADSDSENNDVTEFIHMPRGVSSQMSTPEFWISRNNSPNDVIMTLSEIRDFNSINSQEIICESGRSISLDNIPDIIDGSFLRELMLSAYRFDEKTTYINGKRTPRSFQSEQEYMLNLENIPEQVHVKFAYSVNYCQMRSYPNDTYVYEASYPEFDRMLRSDLHPYRPVVTLYESRDGKWEYILYGSCGGWVRKENIAYCKDKEDWENRKNADEFLVVISKEFRTQTDITMNELSDKVLPMGTVLPLAEKSVSEIRGRKGYGCYAVKVPVRGTDGFIKDEYMFVPASEDVNLGYINFTYENTIRQAYKYLGNIYGYGGNLSSVDCSGLVRNVFSCFGFDMPRTASFQVNMNGAEKIDFSGMSTASKKGAISSSDGVQLIYLPGHIMIYLGEFEGDDYVISSTYGFGEDSSNINIVASVTVSDMDRTYKENGKSWIELSSKSLVFE